MRGRTEYRGHILSNKNDFDLWKRDLDDYLYSEDLMENLYPVIGERSVPAKPEKVNSENTRSLDIYRIWQKEYYATSLAIRASVDKVLKAEIVGLSDPKECYEMLVSKFYVEPPKKEEEKEEKEDKKVETKEVPHEDTTRTAPI